MTRIDLPTEIKNRTPLYVLAGAGDLAVEKLRTVPARLGELRPQLATVQPKAVAGDLQAKARTVYGDLAKRGKSVVTRIRRQHATTEFEAETSTTARRTKSAASTAKR